MQDVLTQTAADVIVADHCWRELAAADGRPYLVMGMHDAEGSTWDLDAMPIHPWAWKHLPTRAAVRHGWGVDDDQLVIGTLSPATRRNVLENALTDVIPERALHVRLGGWGCSHQMVGCDLVVASAGWASSWEARWSGVPHCLVDVGGPDQPKRATHTYASARVEVAAARPALLPPEHTASAEDWVDPFVRTLHLLRTG